jgi:hypothetical protein
MSDINVIVNDEIVNIDVIDEPVLVNVVNSPGVPGAPGVGVPVGGTTGQVLAKNSATNYDTEWVDVSGGAWGTITGTLSNQTDLQNALNAKYNNPTGTTSQYLRGDGSLATFPSLTGYVPYTGATSDVNLGTHRIIAQNATISSSGSGDTVTLNHSSGSGIGLNITKGGNGEGLYINKTGGSGNAATIIGTINATTLVKSGGTSSQFLKADGTIDSSVYVPTSRELTINGVTYDLSANRTFSVGSVTGSGASGQVAYWDGTSSLTGNSAYTFNGTNLFLGGSSSSGNEFQIQSGIFITRLINAGNASNFTFLTSGHTGNLSRYFSLTGTSSVTTFATGSDGGGDFLFSPTGTARMRLYASTGNLLLQNGGTFTDSGQRLQVQGTTLLNGNVTFSSATGMTWDATNSRLGIGLNNPAHKLDVLGSAASNPIFNVVNQFSTVSGDYLPLFECNGPNIQTGGTAYIALGRNRANNNQFSFGFVYAGNNSTLNRFDLNFFGTSPLLSVNAAGSVMMGSTTSSGERLQVTGTMKVTGLIYGESGIVVGASASGGIVRASATNAANLRFTIGGSSLLGAYGAGIANSSFLFSYPNSSNTDAATHSLWGIVHTFNPTSGTTGYIMAGLQPTINQTGGANGITRGLYVNPTLTAAADFRAIEWSNNTGWGLYGAGTANNYLAGSLGIGNTSFAGMNLRVSKNITGNATGRSVYLSGDFQSDVSIGYGVQTSLGTQAATFTLSDLIHFQAAQGTKGPASTIGTQIAFDAAAMTNGGTNIAFRGQNASAANVWNIYMSGTAANYMAGNVLLGSTTDSGERLQVTGTMKVTDTSAFGTNTFTNKLNASFGTIGIQSFAVNNSWFGDNVYYNGTNFVRKASGYTGLFYFQGNEGQFRWGSFSSAGTSVTNGSSSNGLISFKMNLDGTIVMGDLSTVSGVYTGANFILFGSSKNIGVNTTTDIASAKFHINSTTQGFLPPRMTTTQKNAISSPAAGLVVYDTTLNKLCVYTTAWETITSI